MTLADYLGNLGLLILAGGGAFIAWIFRTKAWRVEGELDADDQDPGPPEDMEDLDDA